jgi:glucan biosynthesis protein C
MDDAAFFIISGTAVFYSLKHRKVSIFIKERILRILVPFIFIGIFVIVVPQVYLHRLSNGEFTGNYFQFYPHYFEGGIYPRGNFAVHGIHLWYLIFLFIYSMILLPLFVPFGKNGKSLVSRISDSFERSWTLILLFVPLAITGILADLTGMGLNITKQLMGGWDPFSYIIFFIYGYLIFSKTSIQESISKYSTACLIAAIVLTAPYLYLELGVDWLKNIPLWLGVLTLRALLSWCWIIAMLGLGRKYLNSNNKYQKYINETVLPFYILHQTIIIIIGFYVIQWNINIAFKYSMIVISSLAGIMVIYEMAVRRINVIRFLFGMKSK